MLRNAYLSLIPSFLLAGSCLLSCSSSENKQAEETAQPAGEAAAENYVAYPQDEQALRLQGVYATSLPPEQQESYLQALFDGDTSTYWSSMPGAGPNEGIMLYFSKPTYLKSIQLVQPSLPNSKRISLVQLYVNGRQSLQKDPSAPLELNEEVSALFVRIRAVEGDRLKQVENPGADINGDAGFYSRVFPANQGVAIAEIKLTGKDPAVKVQAPQMVAASLEASSTLSPAAAYGVQRLFDARKELAWAEGAEGSGVGEQLVFRFDAPQKITGLQIRNGFQRSTEHFKANARAKTLVLGAGAEEEIISLEDTEALQTINFRKPFTGRELKLKISEVYEGGKYADLAISELNLLQGLAIITPAASQASKVQQDLLQQAKGTVLQKVLDRNINIQQEEQGYVALKSLILRSDQTFVYYDSEDFFEDNGQQTKEKVADGNWEIKSLGKDKAVIRVFGKLANTSKRTDYYVGNTEENKVRIFQDFVTIDTHKLAGERFIGVLNIYE